jgi:hypothetical protein
MLLTGWIALGVTALVALAILLIADQPRRGRKPPPFLEHRESLTNLP